MTTDKAPATLATAKHGGCVQLGVTVSDEDRAVLQRLKDALPTAGINGWAKGVEVLESLLRQSLGQPSPGGQGDALEALVADWEARPGITDAYRICAEELGAALAARQPVGKIVGWQHCGENHEHMVISDSRKKALKEGETEKGIRKIDAAYSIPLVRQPVGEPVCPDCRTPVLFECTGCSRSNYPPYMQGPIGEIVYSGEGGLQIEFYDGKPLAPMKLYAAPPGGAK